VCDTGDGIPAADLPHVFERFYRVDKQRTQDSGGSGLGLSISKKIMDAHGGRIVAESAVGEGSTFMLTFPVASLA
jgi:signal transduction histidine kinase